MLITARYPSRSELKMWAAGLEARIKSHRASAAGGLHSLTPPTKNIRARDMVIAIPLNTNHRAPLRAAEPSYSNTLVPQNSIALTLRRCDYDGV
jgi:hypothetical protein